MTINIGQVTVATLNIYQGSDLDFDVLWEDPAGTPIDIDHIESAVKTGLTGEDVLSLSEYTTVTANSAHVVVPASVTAGLTPMRRGVWELRAIATDSDEHKAMLRGAVRVFTQIAGESS